MLTNLNAVSNLSGCLKTGKMLCRRPSVESFRISVGAKERWLVFLDLCSSSGRNTGAVGYACDAEQIFRFCLGCSDDHPDSDSRISEMVTPLCGM
jgi:hypothetical protein